MPGIDENRIVRLLRDRFQKRNSRLVQGIGDDAAVLRLVGTGSTWAVTTDMLVEDVDFRRSWLTPSQLGYKSLAVNLSDLAAMGAKPGYFTIALGLPPGIRKSWIEAFYRGVSMLADQEGAVLIGGDLSESPGGFLIAVTAIGEITTAQPVLRSGGRTGDRLYVTGILGRAAAGLALLQQGRTAGRTRAQRLALRAHRMPEPRCQVGAWLADKGFAGCMLDLSDGLSRDLPRLCKACEIGAEVSGDDLPVFAASSHWGCDPVTLALHGGEDFELLFAVPAGKTAHLEKSYPSHFPPIHRIGRLRASPGVVWRPRSGMRFRPLLEAGFDHFRK
jgi:thiamine-monophosphate kinase